MRSLSLPLLIALSILGCKAGPAKPAGFVQSERMTRPKDLPFQRAWRNPKADFARYKKIYITKVDTSHLLEMTWWKKGETGTIEKFKKDIRKIAKNFRKVLREAFAKPPKGVKNRYAVVDDPKGADTLVLEFAIVEIVPSKVVLSAISVVMPFGSGILLAPFNTSTAAMEGRFRDGRTGQVLLTFADREGEKARPVDLGGFTWYTHAKAIMKDWSRQLVLVANQKPGEVIPDTKVFTLKPW